jgi:hypothetical protein
MTQKRGRPVRPGMRVWRDPEILTRRVKTILRRRDKHNLETTTEAGLKLIALAERVMGKEAVTARRRARLFLLARDAKPSVIVRTLLSWRFQLPDRLVRHLQTLTDVQEMRWA